MTNLKLCQYSDSSDEETQPSSDIGDFFGLKKSASDDIIVKMCEHDVVLVNNAPACWKCQMKEYQDVNLRNNEEGFGPVRPKSGTKRNPHSYKRAKQTLETTKWQCKLSQTFF